MGAGGFGEAARGFVRIRICGIIGFSGFLRRARLRLAGACRYSGWAKRNPENPTNPINPDSDKGAEDCA